MSIQPERPTERRAQRFYDMPMMTVGGRISLPRIAIQRQHQCSNWVVYGVFFVLSSLPWFLNVDGVITRVVITSNPRTIRVVTLQIAQYLDIMLLDREET